MRIYSLSLILLLLIYSCSIRNKSNDTSLWIISAPAGNEVTNIDKSGKTVLPNGRFITPFGKSIIVAPHPYGLTLSNDGNFAVTANSGTSPLPMLL